MPPQPPTTRSPAHVGRRCVSALAIFASLVSCQSQEPQPEGVLQVSGGQSDDYAVFIRMRWFDASFVKGEDKDHGQSHLFVATLVVR
jgi:hypothetical protein